MKADDTFSCPKLAAVITRQECFDRQTRGRAAQKAQEQTTPANDYCANRKCGLGILHARLFKKRILVYVPKKPSTRRAGPRGFIPRRLKKDHA